MKIFRKEEIIANDFKIVTWCIILEEVISHFKTVNIFLLLFILNYSFIFIHIYLLCLLMLLVDYDGK